jgi:rubrerythrin
MGETKLSVFDVLQIAIQVEENGVEFYLRAANAFTDPALVGLLKKLARWEKKHIEQFTEMRGRIAEQAGNEHQGQPIKTEIPMPEMMAGLAVFGIHPNPSHALQGNETQERVLGIAVRKEKDAVVFYTGLKDFVSGLDKAQIDEIIAEEMEHVCILQRALLSD